MKRTYCHPRLTVISLTGRGIVLAGSSLPTEQGDDLHWDNPDSAFDFDDEIA